MTFKSCVVGDTEGPHFLPYRWHCLEVSAEKLKHMFTSRDENAVQNLDVKMGGNLLKV
jgi:hypothetical protein